MAARGPDTLRWGPMKPVGLTDPRTGRGAYAVVQLRQDNALGTLYNIVGFQTKLKHGEQTRIFRMIPGLERAEFARLGGLHRNTFLNSPRLLDGALRLKAMPRLRFAGQITGVEGYVESAAIGLLAGRFAAAERLGRTPDAPPPDDGARRAPRAHHRRRRCRDVPADERQFRPLSAAPPADRAATARRSRFMSAAPAPRCRRGSANPLVRRPAPFHNRGKARGSPMSDEVRAFRAARDLLLRHRTDYDAAVREFRWPKLERFNWALDHFDHLPADATALWLAGEGEEKLTFGAMRARSNQVANHLRALGVARGDRVLVLLPNVRQLWEAMLGLMKLGAVAIPATTLLAEADLQDRFARGRIKHAIVPTALTPRFANLSGAYTKIAVGGAPGWHDFEDAYARPLDFAPEGKTRADDPLLLYFTSGTTAKPKMVLHSHQSYPVGHLSTLYVLGLKPGDVHLNISSPGWAKHAWSCFFAPWNAGATVLVPTAARFDAKETLDLIVRCGVTTFCAPPTVWRILVQQDLARWKTRLREALSAGEPLNPEIIAHVERVWGLTVRDFYGQTETTALVGNPPGQKIVPGSMGRALPGYRMRIVDHDGSESDEGEIVVALDPRPTGLMQGYQQDDGTLAAVSGAYYRTGDTGTMDAEGRITFVGRSDDVFKSSDYRISPFEIESALIEHEAVAEAAVVPSPDPRRLAVPKAYIVLAPGHAPDAATARAIFARLRERLAPYARVRRIEFSDLPKTISGKIRRVELRQREAEQRRRDFRGAAEFWEEDFPDLAGRAQ